MANPFYLIRNDVFSLVNSFLFIPSLTLMQVEDQRKSVYLSGEMKLRTEVVSDVMEFCAEISILCRHVCTIGIMYCQDNCLEQYSLA